MFCLPTYGNSRDPFDGIRKFVDEWNQNIQQVFVPGHTVIGDESMAKWKGMHMPGLMVVPRKPTPVGREAHTMCDAQTGIMFVWEPYEGKELMANKEFVKELVPMPDGSREQLGKGGAQILRMLKPYFGSQR